MAPFDADQTSDGSRHPSAGTDGVASQGQEAQPRIAEIMGGSLLALRGSR